MWEPSQATSDKDINGLVLLASAGCRLFGERIHRETVYVLCGGKGTAPGCGLHGSLKVPSGMPLAALWHGEMAAFFLWSAPVAFRRVALETPEWASRDLNHHRQSVSAGKTNAIPTEPSGRLHGEMAAAMVAPQFPPSHWIASPCQGTTFPAH